MSSSTGLVTSCLTSSKSTNFIPEILAYHNLGATTLKSASASASVSVDSRAHAKYAKKFAHPMPISIADLEEVEIIVPKAAQGKVGSKEYFMYQKLVSKSIEHKFGVSLHLVTDKNGAKDGDQVKHLYIQKQYFDTLSKIKALKQQIVEYDMVDIVMVPVGIRDENTPNIVDLLSLMMCTFSPPGTLLIKTLQ